MPDDIFCEPPVRNLPQWDGRWGTQKVHDQETWGASGCHPCSLAMVLRWYAEDNPTTRGAFAFPSVAGSTIPVAHYAQRMAQAFWPQLQGADNLHGQVNAFNNTIDHDGLLRRAAVALGMQPDAKGRFGAVLLPTGGDLLQTIKTALRTGPVVVNMTHPGHFVLVQGYRNGKLLIVDPGNVLSQHWAGVETGVARPDRGQWPGGGPAGNEFGGAAYVALDPHRSYSVANGSLSITFLSCIIRMELYRCAAAASAAPASTTTTGPATTTTEAPAVAAPRATKRRKSSKKA